MTYLELITKLPITHCHSRESGNPEVFMKIILGFVIDAYKIRHYLWHNQERKTL